MSRRASQKRQRFDVFDFPYEDARVEREPAAFLARFKNPNHGRKASAPLSKYDFLQCFARKIEISNRPIDIDDEVVADCSSTKKMEVSNVPIELDPEVTEPHLPWKNKNSNKQIDLDIEDCCRTKQKAVSKGPIELDSEFTELQSLQIHKTRKKKKTDEPIDVDAKEVQLSKTVKKQFTCPAYYPVMEGQEEISELDTSLQYFSSNHKHERIGVLSDDDDRIEIISSSAFASSPIECKDYSEGQLSVHASEGHEIVTSVLPFVLITKDFFFF